MSEKSPTYCKLANTSLNFDMSGMVGPCSQSSFWIKNKDNSHMRISSNTPQEMWDCESRKEFVNDLNNGIKRPECKLCWKEEDAGIMSLRQSHNKGFKDIEVVKEQPIIMVMKPGNLCNNACRTCNSDTSSMWYKDTYELNEQNKTYKEWLKFFKPHGTAYKNNSAMEDDFERWQDKIVFWDWYGGEPMIIPLVKKILLRSIELGTSKSQMVGIHTNGMVYWPKLAEWLNKYKEGWLGYSIDSIEKMNDYIRYGSKWENIVSNLKKYQTEFSAYNNVDLTIRCSPSPQNVFYLLDMYQYFKENKLPYVGLNLIKDFPYNDICYLPRTVKKAVIEKLLSYNNEEYLKWIDDTVTWIKYEPKDYEANQNSFIQYNNKLDKIRKESFTESMPEYAKLFGL